MGGSRCCGGQEGHVSLFGSYSEGEEGKGGRSLQRDSALLDGSAHCSSQGQQAHSIAVTPKQRGKKYSPEECDKNTSCRVEISN